jgi:peptide/nickel transport system permease protein
VTRYLLRRLLALGPTLIGVSVLSFLFLRLVPGDAIAVRLGTSTVLTPQQLAELRAYLGLDRPLPLQYLGWLGALLRGDAGYSLRTGQPVVGEIASRLPVTLELALAAALVALLIGLPLGILSALRPNSALDLTARTLGLLGLSLPNFWLGTLFVLLLARYLRWMPNTGGYVGITEDPWANLRFLLFPALTLGVAMAAVVMRTTRSAMLDVLGADYVRTAHAKGLPASAVVGRHALRNSLIVVVTILGVQVGYLLSGAVVVEEIFSVPGLGRMLLTAINQRDYALVQGTVLVVAILFVAAAPSSTCSPGSIPDQPGLRRAPAGGPVPGRRSLPGPLPHGGRARAVAPRSRVSDRRHLPDRRRRRTASLPPPPDGPQDRMAGPSLVGMSSAGTCSPGSFGARLSLGCLRLGLAALVGGPPLGLVAGYAGGRVDPV